MGGDARAGAGTLPSHTHPSHSSTAGVGVVAYDADGANGEDATSQVLQTASPVVGVPRDKGDDADDV